jgi:hypothetical protein
MNDAKILKDTWEELELVRVPLLLLVGGRDITTIITIIETQSRRGVGESEMGMSFDPLLLDSSCLSSCSPSITTIF